VSAKDSRDAEARSAAQEVAVALLPELPAIEQETGNAA
jgi:hypothetical protein